MVVTKSPVTNNLMVYPKLVFPRLPTDKMEQLPHLAWDNSESSLWNITKFT